MSGIVSTFLDTQLGKGKYLFFLIMWLDFESDITKALNDNWEKFGEAIGTDGLAIRPFSKSNDKTYDEVQKKSGSQKLRRECLKNKILTCSLLTRPSRNSIPKSTCGA